MANLITETQVLTFLNNLMGRRTLPGGTQDDLKGFCQVAFDYAWRYYRWNFSLQRASIDLANDPYMPEDFDLDGYHEVLDGVDSTWSYVPISEYDSFSTGGKYYTLQYDFAQNKYEFITSSDATTVDIIYQVTPPTLATSADGAPFPSAMSVAMGASIYSKQAENPGSADISQEWDEFHAELDRHVGRGDWNGAKTLRRTRQDKAGTFTGDTGFN